MKILILVMMFVLASALCVSDSDVSNEEVQSRRIQALIKDFESGWEDNKAKLAREEIIEIGRPAVPYLGASLDHANREVRWIATITLGAIGGKEVLAPLEKALSDSDKDVRRYAVGYLSSLFPENGQVMTSIKAMLRDEHPQVVLGVMLVLDESGDNDYRKDNELVEKLVADLKNPDEVVRQYAAKALGKIGNEETAIPLARAFCDPDINHSTRGVMANALSEIGSPSPVPILLDAVKSNAGARFKAAEVLRSLADTSTTPILLKLTLSSDKLKAMSAVVALGFKGNKQAVGRLCEIAEESEDDGLKARAIEALGGIGDPAAIKHLERTLVHKDEFIRRQSARALGETGSADAIPALVKALADSDASVVMNSAYALARIGDKDAARDICTLFDRSDTLVDTMSAAIRYCSIGNAANFALHQLTGERFPGKSLSIRTHRDLSSIRNQWRTKLGLPEKELPIGTRVAQMGNEVRLTIVIPGKGHYNLASDKSRLNSVGEGYFDILVDRFEMPRITLTLADQKTFRWENMAAELPYPEDHVCLLVFGEKSMEDNYQCSIGTGKDAAEILGKFIEVLSEEAGSTLKDAAKYLNSSDE